MKTSVSIPDELWAQAVRPGESPSQVVQSALQVMLERRNESADRLYQSDAERISDSEAVDSPETVDELLTLLTRQAKEIRAIGYGSGMAAMRTLDWAEIEMLPPANQLVAELLEWARTGESDLPERFLQRLSQDIVDRDGSVMREGRIDIPISPTMFEGVRDGIVDVADAVRSRLSGAAQDPGEPRQAKPEGES